MVNQHLSIVPRSATKAHLRRDLVHRWSNVFTSFSVLKILAFGVAHREMTGSSIHCGRPSKKALSIRLKSRVDVGAVFPMENLANAKWTLNFTHFDMVVFLFEARLCFAHCIEEAGFRCHDTPTTLTGSDLQQK